MRRTAAQIRSEFIDFFVQRAGHTFAPSSPVVPHDDPTLLFTNAGMNQFKDVFLGQGSRPYRRAVNTQKCIRAGGKHNDLEDVGKDTYHHTFFEMLGNWSFGDYFKAEAIQWAWELLTQIWGLDPNRLHATYFQGDPAENLEPDFEARDLWRKYLPDDRIHPGNKKDNFWEMGDSGPCGPCSELHYDGTPEAHGHALVNAGDPRVIEIWNLVFIQFNRSTTDGKLTPLPAKHVDTGMGFERIARVIQGKQSNYDTDIWTPIFAAIEQKTGARSYGGKLEDHIDIAYRVIADHIRCLTMAITDGARPSNEGRGYVLRRILRRAVRHANQTLGVKGAVMHQLVPAVVDSLGTAFPELTKDPQRVATVIREEEEAFLKTLDRGLELFEDAACEAIAHSMGLFAIMLHPPGSGPSDGVDYSDAANKKCLIPFGADRQHDFIHAHSLKAVQIRDAKAFKLHDTYGFPIDLTRVMAEERGMTVDVAGFERLMEEAREKSRQGGGTGTPGEPASGGDFNLPPAALARLKAMNVEPTRDVDKYHGRPMRSMIKAIWNGSDFDDQVEASTNQHPMAVITEATNFYAESGGQVGDRGRIVDVDGSRSDFDVQETRSIGGFVLHIGVLRKGHLRVGEEVQLTVPNERRGAVRSNHTATHLLNLVLRETLGDEINQKGSLVADDRLRFDFSHNAAMKPEQIETVEHAVNAAIKHRLAVHTEIVPLDKAKAIHGVRAVFGERYPDPVRVVSIGVPVKELLANPGNHGWRQFSVEFCGGTHLATTDEAKRFIILREEALAAGVRRISALTGPQAMAADMAGNDLLHRVQLGASLGDDALPGEFDEIMKLAEELTVSVSHRHKIQAAIETLRSRVKTLRKSAQSAARGGVVEQARALVEKTNGSIIVEQLDGADKDTLLAAMDVFRARRPDAAAMLVSGNEIESKVFIVAAVPKTFIDLGLKAGDWVKQAALACGGSGGGRPDMAQAGGKDPAKVPDAIAAARAYAKQKTNT